MSADGRLYIGRQIHEGEGQRVHSRLAAVNSTTGADLPWAATADGTVFAIASGGSRVIVGGQFDNLDGVAQHGIGAVDPITGDHGALGVSTRLRDLGREDDRHGRTQGHAFIGAEGTAAASSTARSRVNYLDGSKLWFDNCLGATQALVLLNGWLYDGSHMHDCQGQVPGGPPQQANTWWHLTVESPVDGHIGHWFPYTSGNPLGAKAMTTDGTQTLRRRRLHDVNHKAQQG